MSGCIPHQRSVDWGSRVRHPRGRRSVQLRTEGGKRQRLEARHLTLSHSYHLGIGAGSFARLRDEVLSADYCDGYEAVQGNDGSRLSAGDDAGYDCHRRR